MRSRPPATYGLKKILLVDDDDDLREALSEQLVMTEDFDVFEAGDGAEAMEKVKEGIYDLVILDVGLPDTDGRELCRLMRKQGVKCPILMLTGHDSDADTILGLDAGANDYVTKPFKFPVLLARIRAQLRQHEQSEDAVFQLGPYTFKPAMKMLETEDDKKIRLTEKETNILKFLYRAQPGVVAARRAAARGLGLQRRRDHAHAGDPHLPPAPEDRARSLERAASGDRERRLSAGGLSGRLALLIALDQFPRSYWRDTPAAYAQDIKANLLVLEGMSNGHYEALRETWERQFYIIALGHCEGPDHLARLDLAMELGLGLPDIARPPLLPMVERPVQQVQRVRGIIERFGRHPHRNPVYGRLSTAEEEAYIAEGDFPHQGKIEIPGQNAG
jgi:DNA-binding response OmpR family regulator/uncharacterized protein (DUF924 family)